MNTATKALLLMLLFSAFMVIAVLVMQPLQILQYWGHIDLLFPKGVVALKERNLLFILQALMLIVMIPVYIFTFIFSWIYRATNKKAVYDPDLVDHKVAEIFWWGIPLLLTLIASWLTWVKTYELDPYRPLESTKPPLKIQVVALQWKWLFLYPEEKIASVNYLQFPVDRPLHFELTADAPMNSFWIPRLGGQIYAMPNMTTQLHLIANERGDFRGCSANLSGEGFASMYFTARASNDEEYRKWIESVKEANVLDFKEYQQLAHPGEHKVIAYQLKAPELFSQILNKYRYPHE